MTGTNPTPSQRPVGTWELEDFFRSLRACVTDLERAWGQGRLDEVLDANATHDAWHPPIVAAYRRLLRRELRPIDYRTRAIDALLAQARRELFETPHRFEARVVDFARSRGRKPQPQGVLEAREHGPSDAPVTAIAVKSPRGEVLLRMDQVISVRFWGIGFTFDDAEVSDRVTTAVAHEAVNQLAYGLVGLEKVQTRLHGRVLEGELQVIPPPDGQSFEQLMLDVLNEHYPCARRAPLYEDFFEKTDLRLHVRGLKRRRGARAQITRITDPEQHAAKLEQIHNLDEFVILSPPSLAAGLTHPERSGIDRDDLAQLWQLFPQQPENEHELARGLRDLLLAALAQPTSGPRGPLAAVPEQVRRAIQAYATAESFRATERLRSRLSRQPPAP
ncbi:hypothetical protein [Engelhardtia mirabilis]|uniref:Uncharacterized protein n=1 Tax=Engelhardtia mirabilis TaxID=2528011 RepID=A0A518BQF3_9BACT|nr:hypothetical protein Pla133_43200 [Planctomycetes bacterium Pla133]QDV03530.1 hypothetical protein Pla86_43190 [Planctomycetes bacterium Pla86]